MLFHVQRHLDSTHVCESCEFRAYLWRFLSCSFLTVCLWLWHTPWLVLSYHFFPSSEANICGLLFILIPPLFHFLCFLHKEVSGLLMSCKCKHLWKAEQTSISLRESQLSLSLYRSPQRLPFHFYLIYNQDVVCILNHVGSFVANTHTGAHRWELHFWTTGNITV